MDVLLKISIVLVVGIIGGKVAEVFKLPNVSGYLVFGLLLGPSITGLITPEDSANFSIISEFALAIIAFSIGSEFVYAEIKKLGSSILIITLLEVIGAILLVFSVMYFGFKQDFAFSIVIASMSAATAPAATLLVMRQYRAHGPLTKTILPVVALDDILGIMVFSIALSLALVTTSDQALSIGQMIANPLIEIFGSLLLGAVIGFVLTLIFRLFRKTNNRQAISLAAIGLSTGLSNALGLSPLLTNIVVGAMIVNLLDDQNKVFNSINQFASPVYILFFTLAGASLDLAILKVVGWMGLAYIVARAAGKILGAYLGATIVKAPDTVRRNLGFALLPQGGISIGLLILVRQNLPHGMAERIATIIMFSVLVYEVSGPIFAKIAIKNAGEIGGMDRLGTSEAEAV